MQIIITADKCNAPVFFLQKRLQKAQMQTGKSIFRIFLYQQGGYMKQKFKSVKEKMNKLFQKFAPVKEKAEVFLL